MSTSTRNIVIAVIVGLASLALFGLIVGAAVTAVALIFALAASSVPVSVEDVDPNRTVAKAGSRAKWKCSACGSIAVLDVPVGTPRGQQSTVCACGYQSHVIEVTA